MPSTAAEVIEALIDAGSWVSWDTAPGIVDDPAYQSSRTRAAARSGADESVLTGEGRIDGRAAVLIVGEFGYLAGSVGHDAADRVIAAYEEATRLRRPILAAPVSGGTRMQEGTPAFLRMAGIAAAARVHRDAGLPSLVLMRGPTTGGVLASWGSLGQLSVAEPGALIGFLGPRVYQEVMGRPFPAGVQCAEHLVAHGVLDAVVEVRSWRALARDFLSAAMARGSRSAVPPTSKPAGAPHPDPQAWDRVLLTRNPERPGAAQWCARFVQGSLRLSGTGAGEPSPGLIAMVGRLGDRGVVVVAQDRAAQASGELIGPGSLRTARRAMALAGELGLPLVTLIDTPGAELSPEAERGALAGEIARCLSDLSVLAVPVVSVLLGQGAGGAALALLPGDAVIAAANAWLTPLPPEGAAAIVHRDGGAAPSMAAQQRITAAALAEVGAVDALVAEEGDWLAELAEAVGAAISDSVVDSRGRLGADALRRRRLRWRDVGR